MCLLDMEIKRGFMFELENYIRPVLMSADQYLYVKDIDKILDDATSKKIKRKLVICLIENDIGGLGGYIKINKSDAVAMLLNPGIHPEFFDDIISKYQPSFIWISYNYINKIK
jgi:hypothetical protein